MHWHELPGWIGKGTARPGETIDDDVALLQACARSVPPGSARKSPRVSSMSGRSLNRISMSPEMMNIDSFFSWECIGLKLPLQDAISM